MPCNRATIALGVFRRLRRGLGRSWWCWRRNCSPRNRQIHIKRTGRRSPCHPPRHRMMLGLLLPSSDWPCFRSVVFGTHQFSGPIVPELGHKASRLTFSGAPFHRLSSSRFRPPRCQVAGHYVGNGAWPPIGWSGGESVQLPRNRWFRGNWIFFEPTGGARGKIKTDPDHVRPNTGAFL